MEAGLADPALEAGFAEPARDAFEAGLEVVPSAALEAGFAAAFAEDFALDAGLAALEAGLAYREKIEPLERTWQLQSIPS